MRFSMLRSRLAFRRLDLTRRPRMSGTVKSQSRDDLSTRHSLHLAELLDFRPDQGVIRLHEQRVVILSAAAMGLMRKELVDTLGHDTARRVLLRFGFSGWISRRRQSAGTFELE